MTAAAHILGGVTPGEFLRDYWQRRPLLVRGALAGAAQLVGADELAGLACEDFVESRIVTGTQERRDWQLRHGPFGEADFEALGDADWTLLVQAVDHYLDEVAALRQHFHFLPGWRLEDIMVSFAAPGGSVGPHVDQYDVFLLQGHGQRRWRLGGPCPHDAPLQSHPELRLLAQFDTCEDHVLEAGDLLYLPPGWAHWGVALSPCTTYSVGFRAPSQQEVISHFCDAIIGDLGPEQRFRDSAELAATDGGLIGEPAIDRLQAMLAPLLDRERLKDWFASYMTEPRADPETGPDDGERARGDLQLSGPSRAAYTAGDEILSLYVNGQRYDGAGVAWGDFVRALCSGQPIPAQRWRALAKDPQVGATLHALFGSGALSEASST